MPRRGRPSRTGVTPRHRDGRNFGRTSGMNMRRLYTPRAAARYAAALLGIALVAALLGTGPAREPSQGLIVADRAHTASEFASVRAPITGTVISVHAVDHQYVTAGTVLIALSTARYRSDLA